MWSGVAACISGCAEVLVNRAYILAANSSPSNTNQHNIKPKKARTGNAIKYLLRKRVARDGQLLDVCGN